MLVTNFTKTELDTYYENNEVVFLKARKAFLLERSNNCGYFFSEIQAAQLANNSLPYSRKGRYYAFKKSDSIIKEFIPSLI